MKNLPFKLISSDKKGISNQIAKYLVNDLGVSNISAEYSVKFKELYDLAIQTPVQTSSDNIPDPLQGIDISSVPSDELAKFKEAYQEAETDQQREFAKDSILKTIGELL